MFNAIENGFSAVKLKFYASGLCDSGEELDSKILELFRLDQRKIKNFERNYYTYLLTKLNNVGA